MADDVRIGRRECEAAADGAAGGKEASKEIDVKADSTQSLEASPERGAATGKGAAHVVASATIGLSALLITICCAHPAAATPLTPFRYETHAQRHCPDDTVVWLDLPRGIYYLKRQKRYARGLTGSFVCRGEARDNGYRRSLLGLR